MMPCLRSLAFSISVAAVLPPHLAAQVPAGYFVVSAARHPTVPGSAGVFCVHPRTPGVSFAMSGLPVPLTGAWQAGNGMSGPNCVLVRDQNRLLVGDIQPPGRPCAIHVLGLVGSTIATVTTVQVGVVGNTLAQGGIHQMAALPNGDVVFCVWGLQNNGPLNGAAVGRLSLAGPNPIVTPVAFTPSSGGLANAIAVDPSGSTAYVGVGLIPAWTSEIHEVPLAGGPSRLLASLPQGVLSLALDRARGNLQPDLVATTSLNGAPGPNLVYRIQTGFNANATPWVQMALDTQVNGIASERVTGAFAMAMSTDNNGVRGRNDVGWSTPLGATSTLVTAAAGGWSVLTGIDVQPNPVTYDDTSVVNTLQLEVPVRPSSLPTIGNAWFSLEASATAGLPAWYIAGFHRATPAVPIPGSSAGILVGGPIVAAPVFVPSTGGFLGLTTCGIPLPIPSAVALVGLGLNVQVIQIGPTIQASNGVGFTVL